MEVKSWIIREKRSLALKEKGSCVIIFQTRWVYA